MSLYNLKENVCCGKKSIFTYLFNTSWPSNEEIIIDKEGEIEKLPPEILPSTEERENNNIVESIDKYEMITNSSSDISSNTPISQTFSESIELSPVSVTPQRLEFLPEVSLEENIDDNIPDSEAEKIVKDSVKNPKVLKGWKVL